MATITLDREAYLEYRCFRIPDEDPKDIREAVSELRRSGHQRGQDSLLRSWPGKRTRGRPRG